MTKYVVAALFVAFLGCAAVGSAAWMYTAAVSAVVVKGVATLASEEDFAESPFSEDDIYY